MYSMFSASLVRRSSKTEILMIVSVLVVEVTLLEVEVEVVEVGVTLRGEVAYFLPSLRLSYTLGEA